MSSRVFFGTRFVEVNDHSTTLGDILEAFEVQCGYLVVHGETRAAVTMPEEPLPDLGTRDYELIIETHTDRLREKEYLDAVQTLQRLGASALVDDLMGSSDAAALEEYDPSCTPARFSSSASLGGGIDLSSSDYNPHDVLVHSRTLALPFDATPYELPGLPYRVKSFVAVEEEDHDELAAVRGVQRIVDAARRVEVQAALNNTGATSTTTTTSTSVDTHTTKPKTAVVHTPNVEDDDGDDDNHDDSSDNNVTAELYRARQEELQKARALNSSNNSVGGRGSKHVNPSSSGGTSSVADKIAGLKKRVREGD